jgi:3-oxoacyl-[acyl-carrier protein] reductase
MSMLPQRVALVTGASRGLGAAIALAMARRGIAPVLAVRSTPPPELLTALEQAGVPSRVEQCDVSLPGDVRAVVAATLSAFGRLDILVNNAGEIMPIGRLGQTDEAGWARSLDVNLMGPYRLLKESLPALKVHRGVVVNVSSGAADTPREGWSAYCCAKAALAMLTRCVAIEYADAGIAAYGFRPGLIDTRMQAQIRDSGVNDISRVPREHLGDPDDRAALVAWLADTRPEDLEGRDLAYDDVALQGVDRA